MYDVENLLLQIQDRFSPISFLVPFISGHPSSLPTSLTIILNIILPFTLYQFHLLVI